MKLIRNGSYLALIGAVLLFISACGGSATTQNGTNSANNATASKPKDMSPADVTASELSEKDHLGRVVTISGGMLHRIEPDKVRVSVSGGGYITCVGSFDNYMSSSARVKDLADQSKAPSVTIKGTYKKYDGGAVIDPCVMTDFSN